MLERVIRHYFEFQHTAARRRLELPAGQPARYHWFQHTAARRRLAFQTCFIPFFVSVSTHSRPKAAGPTDTFVVKLPKGFNTQPPEGGWCFILLVALCLIVFQHTAARRRLEKLKTKRLTICKVSTHSRPKAAGRKIWREW